MKFSIIITLLMLIGEALCGQCFDDIIIYTSNGNKLIAGIDNCIEIIRPGKSILIEGDQITAFHYTPYSYLSKKEPIRLNVELRDGMFWIHPDSIGIVEVEVNIDGAIEKRRVNVVPITVAVRLSGYGANSEHKIKVSEFKSQHGLVAAVECCGFDAKCTLLEFEMIRIGSNNSVSRVDNKGGRFEQECQHLVNKAESGDLYIFRNIFYICPGSGKQRSVDMIFELE